LIAIDPGKDCGWAQFDDECLIETKVRLVGCGLIQISNAGRVYGPPSWDGVTIIEKPVVYPRSKVNPNDLITLAILVGRIIGGRNGTHELVEPRTWKGTLDGDLMTVRILQQLDEEERRVYFAATDKLPEGVRHNVIDAIGLGLHKLGRLTAAKVAANKKTRSKRK